MPSAWVQHVQVVYRKGKAKGMSYKQAMVAAKKTYKKSGATKAASKSAKSKAEEEPEEAHGPHEDKGHNDVPRDESEGEREAGERHVQQSRRRRVLPRHDALRCTVVDEHLAEGNLHRPQHPRHRVDRISVE